MVCKYENGKVCKYGKCQTRTNGENRLHTQKYVGNLVNKQTEFKLVQAILKENVNTENTKS